MKKLIALFISIVLVLGLAACGNTSSNNATDSNSGKVLVVYYSASGNTERVAKDIAEASGADLFEIEPAEPYTDDDLDWTDSDSRVSCEHDNEAERTGELVSTTVDDFQDASVVYMLPCVVGHCCLAGQRVHKEQ